MGKKLEAVGEAGEAGVDTRRILCPNEPNSNLHTHTDTHTHTHQIKVNFFLYTIN